MENPKQALFDQVATVAKALGHAHRLELLEFLAQGERSVEALVEKTGLSVGNTSQHLQQLRRAGLVSSRRDGKYILYRLSGDEVVVLVAALRTVAEQNLAEVQQVLAGYFHDRDSLEAVTSVALMSRIREDSVTILDVRPQDEYAAGHLPGALNIPLAQLQSQLALLPRDQLIVAYCRGPYCVLSFEAVAALRKLGFDICRYEAGFPEWQAAGLPVESSSLVE
tara:strand:- start:12809 stop:13477 length:669 start_codon:yes stop_codon:yes gene_type:complete